MAPSPDAPREARRGLPGLAIAEGYFWRFTDPGSGRALIASRVAALEHGGIDRARAEVDRRGGAADAVDAPPLARLP